MASKRSRGPAGKISTEIAVRDLKDLQKIIKGGDPINAGPLRRWAEIRPERTAFLADTVWGSVRWEKSLGKPIGPSLHSGFVLDHKFLVNIWYIDLDGNIVDKYTWMPAPAPSVWDGPEDSKYHRFRFMSHSIPKWTNRITVNFSGLSWTVKVPSLSKRLIRPLGYDFEDQGKPIVLPEIEVLQFFAGLDHIRVLG